MKIQFKEQQFQTDATNSVCNIFAGQPKQTVSYMMDKGVYKGNAPEQMETNEKERWTGYKNALITVPEDDILDNLNKVQIKNGIKPSKTLEGKYNLTVSMETGTGKTYTYIKTMLELNKLYGWSKFIIVVPSVAIREGINKSFEITEDHFMENPDYKKKIRYFIYNSKNLHQLDKFANDFDISCMIINSQAFNAKGKDARRINMKLDDFRSRKPIDVIAKTNPILIIDEPQSVEGSKTKERLKDFNPLFTLRYSATHKSDSIYNMVYNLDTIEAFNKKLVKKIGVKGISVSGTTATESYFYLDEINLSSTKAPTATLEFEMQGKEGIRKVTRIVSENYNIYEHSGLEEYKGYIVKSIRGDDNSLTFTNGETIYAGDVVGNVNEEQLRRIQIRETIKSHLEKERQLFSMGIKVLSLFFIDEVAKYKQYDSANQAFNGEYANIFEEEYKEILNNWQREIGDEAYFEYISNIDEAKTHSGYFSIDKKNKKFVDCKTDRKTGVTDDVEAYDLIMKRKEKLLDLKEPVRFIFSHSALREGWDNPNVFQICTLKQSGSDIRKRQEVGRGLRLCVDKNGIRMDAELLGDSRVHNINLLTIIANESYKSFSDQLQKEIAEEASDRPREVNADLFEGKPYINEVGQDQKIDKTMANKILHSLIKNDYIDDNNALTEKYFSDVKNGDFATSDELKPYQDNIIGILDTVFNPSDYRPDNLKGNNVSLKLNEVNYSKKEFRELWEKINQKTAYIVSFESDELVANSIKAIDEKLYVTQIFFKVEKGTQKDTINSKEELLSGNSFKRDIGEKNEDVRASSNSNVKYDLIGKVSQKTGLTRKCVVQILQGISPDKFNLFKYNPEEFIIKVSNLIDEQKATAIVEHISYNKLYETYSLEEIFTDPTREGKYKYSNNSLETPNRHVFDHLISDSETEKELARRLEVEPEVCVYAKLPKGFFISTPVGDYNPDWAIAFNKDSVKHIYFVAETKGQNSSLQIKLIEDAKIECATKHFNEISGGTVKYEFLSTYDALLSMVKS